MRFYILHYKRKGIFRGFRARKNNRLQVAFLTTVEGTKYVFTVQNHRVVMLSLFHFNREYNFIKSRVDHDKGIDIAPLDYLGNYFNDSEDFACELLKIKRQNIYDWSVMERILID